MDTINKPDLGQFRIPENPQAAEASVQEAFTCAHQLANPNKDKDKTEEAFHKHFSNIIDASETLVIERLFYLDNNGKRRR